ncbi:hypothetical protein VHEMI02464 [[Torrubiella] hemipterigena]|uniref:Reverse transcriptase domain-containing protein n=1 Tax=[Torrubiella] hemipterigena TaxID=1531966 RepID=A0A0A1SPP1_9HYPO|nr:hypothetical protein VHEMI02464 [[Torrubiella] hemipterigena]
METNDLALLTKINSPTTMGTRLQRTTSTIDLIFSNVPGSTATIEEHLTPKARFEPPPIQINNLVYTTDEERAQALLTAKLATRSAEEDIEFDLESDTSSQHIPFEDVLSKREVEDSLLRTGNTTPGADGITTKMLRAVWPSLGDAITLLYSSCLRLGYHPEIFRIAEVVMIPKPNKRDLSSPTAWRPISLLPCLSKGLERAIARRLAFLAIKYKIIPPKLAGALPRRLAIDIVLALIFDIESEAFKKRLVATLVTMDTKGAFDAVLRNRLIKRLCDQGWPRFLVKWVFSFMSLRKAYARFGIGCSGVIILPCGLPQGSLISPILYLLYIVAIYSLDGADRRYGYADDTAMLFIGKSLTKTTQRANEAIKQMVE